MPAELTSVPLASVAIDRFQSVLEPEVWSQFAETMQQWRDVFKDRVLWNVNSTARGGGVAELLASLIPYQRGAGVDTRWLVITGSPTFFALTKRIHNLLHGATADGAALSDADRTEYERTLLTDVEPLRRRVRPGDVIVLHDPQTAGLIPALIAAGCRVVWRCHVGVDRPNPVVRQGWDFLRPYVRRADAVVFSRRAFVWDGLEDSRVDVILPSIDPFTPKNQELSADVVSAILRAAHLVAGVESRGSPAFTRSDGTTGSVTRQAEMFDDSRPPIDARLVVQVSRWDRLKDPLGVMDGFARHVAPQTDAHLLLAGPAASAIADDPEGPAMLREVERAWSRLPPGTRARVHLAGLPMADLDENAIMVNALQRRAQVIVQKSLAEGFGLTVAEAMWKARPVVATRVGGIQDQIQAGQSGVLIDDPHDLAAFGAAVTGLLQDPPLADRLGAAAKARVRREFLAPRQLMQEARLVMRLV